ncbi:MAG: FtsX-like permease family protein, partial [Pseudomonadota bacterium]
INWKDGLPIQGRSAPTQAVIETMADKLIPTSISAAFVGLTSPIQTFEVQRFVNRYRREALTAAMPALTLYEMWGLVGTAETALLLIAAMVVITSLVGMVTMILATLAERRRELAILRAMGAGPRTVLGLVLSESTILAALGVLLGVAATYTALYLVRPVIDRAYGLSLDVTAPTTTELMILGAIILGGALAGLVPAMRAYAMSLADGMSVRN